MCSKAYTRKSRSNNEQGQAVLMITVSILAMFGVLGLAVDLGWGYYVHFKARAAADAAALGAVEAALQSVSSGAAFNCGSNGLACHANATACDNPPANPATDNIGNGCLYAKANGFTAGGNQNVTMQARISAAVPT